ncbi:MAG: type II secretion system protein J [Bilophila wadsworthia]
MRSDVRAPERGFTLLEIVCTLVILGVLGSLVFSGFGTALTGYTQMREVGTSDMQAELALIRLRKELAGAADFPGSPFKDSPSVTFTKTDGTQTTISCEDTGSKLLIDGQILLSDVASCRFTTNGAGPSYIGIVLTQQLAERQITWTLSVAPRNTPPAKD